MTVAKDGTDISEQFKNPESFGEGGKVMIIKKIAEKKRALCIQMIPQTEEDRTLCADLQEKGFLDGEGKNAKKRPRWFLLE